MGLPGRVSSTGLRESEWIVKHPLGLREPSSANALISSCRINAAYSRGDPKSGGRGEREYYERPAVALPHRDCLFGRGPRLSRATCRLHGDSYAVAIENRGQEGVKKSGTVTSGVLESRVESIAASAAG